MTSAAIAAVRARFLTSLPARAGEIEAALATSDAAPLVLTGLMHKLAGAAGFYGLNDIAELAADLERRLELRDETNADHVRLDIERLVRLLRNRGRDIC